MQKCLLFLILSYLLSGTYQPIYGQNFLNLSEDLVSDSWHNAGRWFKKPTELKKPALLGLGAIAIISGTMVWDEQIQPQIAQGNPAQLSSFSQISEPFGNPLKMGILALGSYYTAAYLKNGKIKGASSAALQSMLTAGVAAMTIKLLVHRVRPEEQLIFDPYQFKGASFSGENLSFPSGHSATAFAFAASVSSYYENDWRIAVPLYLIAGLTAYQRVYDFKHWPSDVVAGALLGTWIGTKIGAWQRERNSSLSLGVVSNQWGGSSLNFSFKLD
ncbi:MAG: hypothetical protein DA405_11020 [Bacteroidetes bacterium]|nr:MAG: hypothetical protein DA405_11020 [Bacteroidota bacterium]